MIGRDPAVILKDAAAYIEQHGWCKGAMSLPTGEVCAAGAIHEVTRGNLGEYLHGLMELEARIRDQLKPGDSTSSWNDRPERRKAEVIAALRGEL